MHRRTLFATAVGLSFGGCLSARPPQSRVAWIRLVSERDEPHDVAVRITDGGEPAFADAYRLGAGRATRRIASPVEEPGRYVVRFRADGQQVHVDLAEYVDGDTTAIGVQFVLHAEGTMGYTTEATAPNASRS
ncbi:hypothetical protein [Halorarius halobius]|uniref:hypothetical protein n=1 Tax=Halorarius halobius TaxID=2962671 RepID=UPI0020CE395F|nr:hypothetical protein [Halorarius halobius]